MTKKVETPDLSNRVMDEIHQKHIKMHPHTYYVLASLLLVIGVAGIILATTFFTNVVIYYFRSQNPLHHLWRNRFGWGFIIAHLPWLAILLAIAGLVGGLWMLHQVAPLYKRKISELVVGLVVISVLGGIVLDYLGINERLEGQQQVTPVYHLQPMPDRLMFGQIEEYLPAKNQIILKGGRGMTRTINILPGTSLPDNRQLKPGDQVQIIVHCVNGSCSAETLEFGNTKIETPPQDSPMPVRYMIRVE